MFDIDFDSLTPAELSHPQTTKKTKYTAKQVIEWLKEKGKYQSWIDACNGKAVKLIQSVKKLVSMKDTDKPDGWVEDCAACSGTGIFGKWARGCFRCGGGHHGKGRGWLNAADVRRNFTYDNAKKGGVKKSSYQKHESSYGFNQYMIRQG